LVLSFFSLSANGADDEKSVLGSLKMTDQECSSSVVPNFDAITAAKLKELEAEKNNFRRKNNFVAYYGEDTELKLTAVDDEDNVNVADNGAVIVDDNRAQSSSIELKIPVSKLFGRKNNRAINFYELEKTHNKGLRTAHSTILDKFLDFKSSAEKLQRNRVDGAIIYKGSHKDVTALRKSAVSYFSHSDPTTHCVSTWLTSSFISN